MIKIWNLTKVYLKKYKAKEILFMIIVCCNGMFSLILPILSGKFIDLLVQSKEMIILYKFCVLFLLISVLNIGVGYIANRVYVELNTLLAFEFSREIITYVQKIKWVEFEKFDIAKLSQQINIDTRTVINFLFELTKNIILNIMKLIVPILVICAINFRITLVILCLMISYAISYRILKKFLFVTSYETKEKQTSYYGSLYEQIEKTKFIRVHGIIRDFMSRAEAKFRDMLQAILNLQKIQYAFSALDTLIMTIGQIGLFLIGGNMVMNDRLTIGNFTLISSYFIMEVSAMRYFFGIGQKIQDTLVSCNRISELQKKHIEKEGGIKLDNINKITLSHLSFSFGEHEILKDLSVCFKRGNSYAIIGANGSGKTTLTNILLGLYLEYSGDVCFNGIELKSLDLVYLRKKLIGVVEQSAELLNDSILNNLSIYGEKGEKKILEQKFHSKFLQNRKTEYLSGGERQKVALLRETIKNPDVFILDEPTSALDKENIKEVADFIVKKKQNKIVIVITHESKITEICDYRIELE